MTKFHLNVKSDVLQKSINNKKSISKNKQFAINMVAQLIGFFVNMGISFFLTPFIVNNVGSEAYGFFGLANNFVSYAALITVAINSMAGRFISINYHQHDIKGANKYFTSVIVANIVIGLFMILPATLIIIYLDHIVNISNYILADVKLLWIFVFLGFIINLIFSTYNIAPFIKNKLYLSSLREIASQIIRVIILIVLYSFFQPSIWYVGFAFFICIVYKALWNKYYCIKLIPEIKYAKKNFNFHSILEIISSGIWNTLTQLAQVLNVGLDLLITNVFISSAAMGQMAVSKTIPTAMSSLIGAVSSVFVPSMTKLYAENKIDELVSEIKRSMKIMTLFSVIPNVILISFGKPFYELWVPNENHSLLYILSILTAINTVITGTIFPLYSVFTITNKVKVNSILTIIRAILSTLILLVVLKLTDLDIYGIAGVSTIFSIIHSLVFHVPQAAKYLNLPWYAFFSSVIKSIYCAIALCFLGIVINYLVEINSWWILISVCICYSIIAFMFLFYIVLSKTERENLIGLAKSKLSFKQ